MKKTNHKFKFEVTFNLSTIDDEKLDKQSIKQFENALFDFVYNYAGDQGCFYTYAKDYDDETFPEKVKIKKVKA